MAVDFRRESVSSWTQPLALPDKITRSYRRKGEFHTVLRPVPGLHRVRWYPCAPGAKPIGIWTWLSNPDLEDDHFDEFQGPGVLRRNAQLRPNTYPQAPGQHFHGPPEWLEFGIPPDAIGTCVGDNECFMFTIESDAGIQVSGAAVCYRSGADDPTGRIYARITDYSEYKYSAVEVIRQPPDEGTFATTQTVVWVDKPDGLTWELTLYERNSFPNVPLGSYVEVYAQLDDTWVFNYDRDHFPAVVTANLGGGDYSVVEKYPLGEGIENARMVRVSEDNLNSQVPLGTNVLVWSEYKMHLWTYHFAYPRFMLPPPDGCGECTTVLVDVDITQEITVGDEGVQYFVFNTSDGSMALFQWVCVPEQFCGWFDLCACAWVPWWCTVDGCFQFVNPPGGATGPFTTPEDCAIACDTVGPYWCTSGGCIQAAAAPPGTISGPYDTIEECEAACVDTFWWCTEGGCVEAAEEPPGALSGPYATLEECEAVPCVATQSCCDPLPGTLFADLMGEGDCTCTTTVTATSPDGATVDLTVTSFCGAGNRSFIGNAHCAGSNITNWVLDLTMSDADDPECIQTTGSVAILTDIDHTPSCSPLSLWFRFETAPSCCGLGSGTASWLLHIYE